MTFQGDIRFDLPSRFFTDNLGFSGVIPAESAETPETEGGIIGNRMPNTQFIIVDVDSKILEMDSPSSFCSGLFCHLYR